MNKSKCLDLSDSRLVELMSDGDQSAFSVIYKRYWADLYNSAYKRLKDHSQSQDVLQSVFTDLWARRRTVEIRILPAFLHGAVRFQVYKVVHKAKLQSDFISSFGDLLSGSGGDDKLIETELQTLLEAWTAALPAKRQQIFRMRYERGLTTGEIAGELGLSQKTVQNQLNTACSDITARLLRISPVIMASFLPF